VTSLTTLEKRVAALETERRVVKTMSPTLKAKIEEIKAGIPDRAEHMKRLEASRGR
jgi:hypothetical protein